MSLHIFLSSEDLFAIGTLEILSLRLGYDLRRASPFRAVINPSWGGDPTRIERRTATFLSHGSPRVTEVQILDEKINGRSFPAQIGQACYGSPGANCGKNNAAMG
jgi:hypothetical protein